MKDLNLVAPILKALDKEGYKNPTEIQQQAIPELLEGKDLLGCAQTGTGKTAAFALPILNNIYNDEMYKSKDKVIKGLVIAPTRELAVQISENFKKYSTFTKIRTTTVYGGVPQRFQTRELKRGVDVVVATPGRLLDLIQQGQVDLNYLEHFVLDEADLMLDMGMIDDVKRIVKYIPKDRQTMLFSATMPPAIERLTRSILKDPVNIEVTPVSSTVDRIKQEVYFVHHANKTDLLIHLLKDEEVESALIFTRTKHGANRLVHSLNDAGFAAQAIHGDKSQKQRQRALNNFKKRNTKVLVATDIAARGIDISELSHVFNYNLPEVPETYVHRIGRTGRSGNEGVAISFCDNQEKSLLRGIERLSKISIPVNEDHPYPLTQKSKKKRSRRRKSNNSRRSNQSNNNNSNQRQNSDNKNSKRKNNRRKNSRRGKGGKSFDHSQKNNNQRGRRQNRNKSKRQKVQA